ncbi:hypothetical protein D9613_010819 [Agrocybe pediades]|uniref:Uncharacterized protein n=1 Tax=Agrocybe pediades TaxID=84607 RepID=A0A8H4QLL1_9AGAR|nr:hypothetical protein D9613_010819 [Agrocybe pediades]
MEELINAPWLPSINKLELYAMNFSKYHSAQNNAIIDSALYAFSSSATTLHTNDDTLRRLLEWAVSYTPTLFPDLVTLSVNCPWRYPPVEEEPPHHEFLKLRKAIGRPVSVLDFGVLSSDPGDLGYLEEHVGLLENPVRIVLPRTFDSAGTVYHWTGSSSCNMLSSSIIISDLYDFSSTVTTLCMNDLMLQQLLACPLSFTSTLFPALTTLEIDGMGSGLSTVDLDTGYYRNKFLKLRKAIGRPVAVFDLGILFAHAGDMGYLEEQHSGLLVKWETADGHSGQYMCGERHPERLNFPSLYVQEGGWLTSR